MSSGCGPISWAACSKDMKLKLLDESLTVEGLVGIKSTYLECLVSGDLKSKGFPYGESFWELKEYGASKLFLQVLCQIWGRSPRFLKGGVQVYSVDPGVVKTQMTKDFGWSDSRLRTPESGAETAIFVIEKEFKLDPHMQGGHFDKNCGFWDPLEHMG